MTTTHDTAATEDAADETVTDLLAAVVAEAGALLRSRRPRYTADAHPALRRLAGYAAETLAAAGAGPVVQAGPPGLNDAPIGAVAAQDGTGHTAMRVRLRGTAMPDWWSEAEGWCSSVQLASWGCTVTRVLR